VTRIVSRLARLRFHSTAAPWRLGDGQLVQDTRALGRLREHDLVAAPDELERWIL
jgi:hypothetical protein